MPGALDIDLSEKLDEMVIEIFQTMIPLPLEKKGGKNGVHPAEGTEMLAILGFTGTATGSISVSTTRECAKKITAALLMMDPDEEIPEEDVADALGELSNMVGGNLKNAVVEGGIKMNLAAPAIVDGQQIHTSPGSKIIRGFTRDFQVEGKPLSVSFSVEGHRG
ncbi:MAG TPA: chemotaxis protein CheX [Planctomycetes bacterium]|nr:chemotaxis protein CheX [Planctomycetota bacterium]